MGIRPLLLPIVTLCVAAMPVFQIPRSSVPAAAGAPTRRGRAAVQTFESPGAVVRGRVVTGDSGLPVPDAAVTVIPLNSTSPSGANEAGFTMRATAAAVVDPLGRFEVTGLAPGYYRLQASPGTTYAQYLTGRFPDPITDDPPVLAISGSGMMTAVEIRLPRAAVITGRVVDDRGAPLAAVTVTAQSALPGSRWGMRSEQLILPARTDDLGSFRLFGLAPGDYVLHARPMVAGHLTMTLAGGRSATRYGRRFAPAYYPGTGAAAHAARVRVGAGDTYGPIEFPLAEARLCAAQGIVLSSSGHPVPNTRVHVRRAAATLPFLDDTAAGGATGADGTFQIGGLTPDEYVLSVTRFAGDVREMAWTPVQVFDDVSGVALTLQAGAAVRGQIHVDGPAPRSLAGLQLRSAPVGLATVEPVSVQPAADGTFVLQHQHGPTLIRADGLRGWHLHSVVYGGEDITDRPTEFPSRGADLQVILTPRAATLAGVVRTARGSAGRCRGTARQRRSRVLSRAQHDDAVGACRWGRQVSHRRPAARTVPGDRRA